MDQTSMSKSKTQTKIFTFCAASAVANSTCPYPLKLPSKSVDKRISTTSPASLKKFFLQNKIDRKKVNIYIYTN